MFIPTNDFSSRYTGLSGIARKGDAGYSGFFSTHYALRTTHLVCICAIILAASNVCFAQTKPVVAVCDFVSTDDNKLGIELADSIRLHLARHAEFEVIDQLTMQSAAPPLFLDTPRETLNALASRLAANILICCSVARTGKSVRADVRCEDLRNPFSPVEWTKTFTDDTERARGLIAQQVVEAITGKAEWTPPEYGQEAEPNNFGPPLNANGSFDAGNLGWEPADNVSTFIVAGPGGRGKILRIRTDLLRDPWLEYRRKLLLDQADANHPPEIPTSTGYDSVGGLEGVHFRSDWIKAEAAKRYWLTADVKGAAEGDAFPKIFVKGYRDMSAQADGLSERSLIEKHLTPETFAALPPERQKAIIAEDVKLHPDRYRREVYRWYLPCRFEVANPRKYEGNVSPATLPAQGRWGHFAAPFPPRGGLPADVQWLQIQVYAYWPAGEYLFDNVMLYADPAQKAPLPEEPARTPK